jgi:hypothetical protein
MNAKDLERPNGVRIEAGDRSHAVIRHTLSFIHSDKASIRWVTSSQNF